VRPLTATNAYDAAGSVGLRANLAQAFQGSGETAIQNTITFDNFSATPTAVPEPSSLAVVAIGGLLALRRGRRSAT
jgi:hypothetical protein